ncbi:alpha/beta fold hydrolase [Microbacterium aerolatum]|uniref:alpha/beta fold hydrolase n=1 Tax=Microbacterium aerolatum TaxID=153731 RepID=UPI002000E5F0|nr:alpha/beta fold hydrolase [Microbacterium aerolatum]MCK3769778.1 alpha/beta fold hydrolase [Microbacterium aerolatum]
MHETVVFLHGLGLGPDSWSAQLEGLPAGFTGIALPVPGLAADDATAVTLSGSANAVVAELEQRGIARAHVCGLSLGAMVALQVAIDHPDKVASLVLSGGQVRPPRALMAVQSLVMRALPARLVAPDGTSKQRVLDVLREVSRMDLTDRLGAVQAPTLVLCGSRDRANLPAARHLAAGSPHAELQIIDGGGHELNTGRPEEFTTALTTFLTGIRR